MFRYAMKAAADSNLQIADRIKKFEELGIKPVIELFLSEFEEIEKNSARLIDNCIQYRDCEYLVHFPIHDFNHNYIYDAYNEGWEGVEILLDFCRGIKSNTLITHRCCGFNKEIDKNSAEEIFLKKIILWDGLAKKREVKILVENYGFVWFPKTSNKEYAVSPLDHFFPWDILKFQTNLNQLALRNTAIILDVAHATISSNMFNMLKKHPHLNSDERFANIFPDDLERKDSLHISDFLFDFIDYFHISDSFVWSAKDGITNLKKFLYSEGLPIGHGNIDYRKIFENIINNKTIVMEIEPENGDHSNNISQLKAIKYFMKSCN